MGRFQAKMVQIQHLLWFELEVCKHNKNPRALIGRRRGRKCYCSRLLTNIPASRPIRTLLAQNTTNVTNQQKTTGPKHWIYKVSDAKFRHGYILHALTYLAAGSPHWRYRFFYEKFHLQKFHFSHCKSAKSDHYWYLVKTRIKN